MKTTLTAKQQQVYDFIENYRQLNHTFPTLKEIGLKLNKSIPTIHQYLTSIKKAGYLKDQDNANSASKAVNTPSPSYSIGIVGYGIVGQAVGYGFSNYKQHIYDKYKNFESLKEVVSHSEFIFICLPTPIKSDESGIDLSIINENIAKVTKYCRGTDKIVVIKSTVVPGTTAGLMQKYPNVLFCFNPEFLREASFLQDFVNTDRIVIGATTDSVFRRLSALYQSIMPTIPIYYTDPTSAEMVKYMANCYLATKVIFANEMYDICHQLGIKYEEVKKMVVADHRIEDTHLDVTSIRGFGQKCFPKDLLALRALAKIKKTDVSILDAVWKKNLAIRRVRDWEEIPFAVSPSFGHKGKLYCKIP